MNGPLALGHRVSLNGPLALGHRVSLNGPLALGHHVCEIIKPHKSKFHMECLVLVPVAFICC